MASDSFGKIFTLTTFGESHGPAIGGVVSGCPAGLEINTTDIQLQVNRRKPQGQFWATPRNEDDQVETLSGLADGITTGAPIAFIIRNMNQKPGDYQTYSSVFRPSHADFTWEKKFGRPIESGSGRQSARETVARVAGGAIARQYINTKGIKIESFVRSIGPVAIPDSFQVDPSATEKSKLGCPDEETEKKMIGYLHKLHEKGDTTGGTITCLIKNVPAGLGEPVYDKLQARLAYAMLSINAVKGFEYGEGFAATAMTGSSHNDIYISEKGTIHPKTNHAGGILGGISTGETIMFTVAFKPVSTLMQPQASVNRKGEDILILPAGRHDVCVVPRSRVIVESMAALVVADMLLLSASSKI